MSYFSSWLEAVRLRTLPAAVAPVLVGASLAWNDNQFHLPATLAALGCALLIQIATNFANDYFDHIKGADSKERVGFVRASASGLIPPSTMLTASIITFVFAFLLGLYLVWIGGWVILLIGISAILAGLAYTGGPFPLAYNGLGDVFAFIFFGVIAVTGTYYVNALQWSVTALLSSLAIGALCTNILIVNNLRDIKTDAKAGKRTLGVLLGERFLIAEFTLMLAVAYTIPVILWAAMGMTGWLLITFLSLPHAVRVYYHIITNRDKRRLNPVLGKTAQLMLIYGILFALAAVLG